MPVEHHAHVHGLAVVVECLVALEAGVRQVLLADILALGAGAEASVTEAEDVVDNPVGREGQRLVAEVGHAPVGQLYGDAFHAVP